LSASRTIRFSFKRHVSAPLRQILIPGPPPSLRGKIPKPLRKIYRSVRKTYRDISVGVLSIGLPRAGEFIQPQREIDASRDMSIVVPVKDAPAITRRCLLSLETFASQAEVIIVDDASELQATVALLDDFCGRNQWAYVRHENSKGHSRSCEAGASIATRPYLCLLNSDTVVTPWSWWAAKDAFESDPNIGVTGTSTSYSGTAQTIGRAKLCRHYWNDSQICAFAKKYIAAVKPRPWVDLPEVGGFAFFIRRALWKHLGGFDPNLPDYGNECELCRRILKRRIRVVWTQKSYIHHFGAQSYGEELFYERSRAAQDYIHKKHN